MTTAIKYDTLQNLHNLASHYNWQKSLEVFDTALAHLIDLVTYSEEPVIIVDPGNSVPYIFSFANRYAALAML